MSSMNSVPPSPAVEVFTPSVVVWFATLVAALCVATGFFLGSSSQRESRPTVVPAPCQGCPYCNPRNRLGEVPLPTGVGSTK